jgi:Arc/MetJ-type ribon-helix-helix transcriptional regulator
MTQLTLSLPDGIQTYIDEQLSQGGYRSAEDFVLQLILQSQTRSDAIGEVEVPSALQAFQNAGLVGCVEIEPTASYKTIVQDYVVQKHQHNQL